MRLMPVLMMTVIISLGVSKVYAVVDVTFYSDGVIQNGNEYEHVYVFGTLLEKNTTVDMFGGLVDDFIIYGSNTGNIGGGEIDLLFSYDSSIGNISGGVVNSIFAYGHSMGNITGGIVGAVGAYESSILNISGGEVTEWLYATGSSTVNIFGYDLAVVPVGGLWGHGMMTGLWNDGTAFTINLYDDETYSHINLIPEPATVLLFGLGGLVLLRKRKT